LVASRQAKAYRTLFICGAVLNAEKKSKIISTCVGTARRTDEDCDSSNKSSKTILTMNASGPELTRNTNRSIVFVVQQFLPTQVRDGCNKVRAWEYLVTSGNPRLLRCMFVANVAMLSSLRLGNSRDHSCAFVDCWFR